MPQSSKVFLTLVSGACTALVGTATSTATAMPDCEVRTASARDFAALSSRGVLESFPAATGTNCAESCLASQECSAFTLDLLAEEPVCSLFAPSLTSPAARRQDGKGTLLRGVAARKVPVVLGVCREDHQLRADTEDMPLLLGMDYFEKGVDAVNDTVNRTKHIRLPIYNFHFVGGKSYFDPYSQVAYKIPDEISFTPNAAGYEQIDSMYTDVFTESVSETTKRYSWNVGIQLNFGQVAAGVTYSDNKQWYNFNLEEHERMNYNSHSIMWWKFYETQAYPFDVLGSSALDPIFKTYIDQLPKTIAGPNDTKKYNTLLDNWGTHYCTWANFGGSLDLDIFTNGTFDRSQTQEWKSDQHSLAFHFTLYDIDPSAQIAGFTNKSQIHVNQSFMNASRVRLYYEGGDPTLMDQNSLQPWLNSVRKQPHWLNVTYQPLSKLPFLDSQTANTLDGFIMDYLKQKLA